MEQWCGAGGGLDEIIGDVGFRQWPNQSRWRQVDKEGKEVDVVRVAVTGGAGVALGNDVANVVVVRSLHPNQPGVWQVEVEVVEVDDVLVVVVVVLVVSSRHPHHPGVLQVEVRVRVVVQVDEDDVVKSDPLLSKYFQLKQSTHSSSAAHFGTSSYF